MPAGMAGMILLGLQSIAKSLWFGTIKFSLQYTVLTFSAPPGKVTSKCNCAQVIADHARYPARTRVLDFASGVCSHSELEWDWAALPLTSMPANKYPAANWNSVIVAMPAGMPVDWFNLLLVPTAVARYGLGSCVLEYTRVHVCTQLCTAVHTLVYYFAPAASENSGIYPSLEQEISVHWLSIGEC